ncbi:MAG: sacsin N-terminal ATP-binding-like domain-containing protein, partial [Mycobacteriales bacterium]
MAAWAASPARFREDANAEDDLALGGYRDRLLVELAQNASDAAGAGGTLCLSYDGGVLLAANTGAPLDAAGVAALASLRASAKRGGGTVGRFGVGFAAVAAVSDEVVITSTTGAVRFSRTRTAQAVAGIASLAGELAARQGRVPLLRLAWPAEDGPAGRTEVRVVVRPDSDAAVRALLAGLDPTLLLVLPGLVELDVNGRVLTAEPAGDDVLLGGVRWRVARGQGELDPGLLADRPVEERDRTRWEVTWAVPVDAAGVPEPLPVPAFVRAPTATDDPMSLPAMLAATLPLGPDRRRVLPGALTDAVLAAAADVLAGLVLRLADTPERLVLVPGPFGGGEVDARLCAAVLGRLLDTAFLAGRRPDRAQVLDGASAA